jgi:hypothetical protein
VRLSGKSPPPTSLSPLQNSFESVTFTRKPTHDAILRHLVWHWHRNASAVLAARLLVS